MGSVDQSRPADAGGGEVLKGMSDRERSTLLTDIFAARSTVAATKTSADTLKQLTVAAKLAAAQSSLTEAIEEMEKTDDKEIPGTD